LIRFNQSHRDEFNSNEKRLQKQALTFLIWNMADLTVDAAVSGVAAGKPGPQGPTSRNMLLHFVSPFSNTAIRQLREY
jgi:hypothetical protein